MNESKPDKLLLWLDLESTGLDTSAGDEIIEIGCILTTDYLRTLGEFAAVVKPSDTALSRLFDDQFLVDMHTANGLLDEIDGGRSITWVEHDLLAWLDSFGTSEPDTNRRRIKASGYDTDHVLDVVIPASPKFTLACSGVGHFDLPTVREHMPRLAGRLNYFVLDVGVIRRAHEMWVSTPVSAANDAKTHRALDDVRCHLDEARAFQDLWRDTQLGSLWRETQVERD